MYRKKSLTKNLINLFSCIVLLATNAVNTITLLHGGEITKREHHTDFLLENKHLLDSNKMKKIYDRRHRESCLNVKRKPHKCMKCGGNVVSILYGEPSSEGMKLIDSQKMVMGGCLISKNNPEWACVDCETTFRLIRTVKNLSKFRFL